MGKNTKKYLNSEKIKQLIKLITEEPKIDDQLHGHKFPYVAFQILKSDCPFIAKRFVLNEQEYHEEYPDSPEDEIDELGLDLDIENENENKEIEFDFKKNKIEFEKIYQQIEENFVVPINFLSSLYNLYVFVTLLKLITTSSLIIFPHSFQYKYLPLNKN